MANELTYQSVFTGQEMDERFAAVAQLQAALLEVETALSAKYVKPASGIPETDLDSAVQSALAKARSAVQDLSNYYTKTEIDSLLAAVNSQEYVDVATLPTASASTLGKIYLVGPTDNQYDRYYTSYDGSDYSWVAAGSTEINLSNYATKAELNQLDQKVTNTETSYPFDFSDTTRSAITNEGNIASGSSYLRSALIEVKENDVIEFDILLNANDALIAATQDDVNFVVKLPNENKTTTQHVTWTSDINGYIVVSCNRWTQPTTYTIKREGDIPRALSELQKQVFPIGAEHDDAVIVEVPVNYDGNSIKTFAIGKKFFAGQRYTVTLNDPDDAFKQAYVNVHYKNGGPATAVVFGNTYTVPETTDEMYFRITSSFMESGTVTFIITTVPDEKVFTFPISQFAELGGINFSIPGWRYDPSGSRWRTRQGVTLSLHRGDIIKIQNILRVYIGWITSDGTYHTNNVWYSSDIVLPADGEYVIMARLEPETICDTTNLFDNISVVTATPEGMIRSNANLIKLIDELTQAARPKNYDNIAISVAHQGYPSYAPENTIPAFIAAWRKGYDYIETDVRFTSDGYAVLLHDATVDATSDGSGAIADMTLAEVRELDFGSWKNPYYAGTKIPTLAELCACCRQYTLYPQLEIKTGTDEQIRGIVNTVREYGLFERAMFTSFNESQLAVIKSYAPNARLGLVVQVSADISAEDVAAALRLKNTENEVWLFVNLATVTEAGVNRAIEGGLRLGGYNANESLTKTWCKYFEQYTLFEYGYAGEWVADALAE